VSDLFGNNGALGSLLGKKRGVQDLFGSSGKKPPAGAPAATPGRNFTTAGQGPPEQRIAPAAGASPTPGRDLGFTSGPMRTVGNYDGPAFATNHSQPWKWGDPIGKLGGGPNRDHKGPTEHGMWRLDTRDPWSYTWVWWEGDTTGMSLHYNSKTGGVRTAPDPDFLPADPTVDDARDSADDRESEFRVDMQPYLDELANLQAEMDELQVPDIDTKTESDALLAELRRPLTSSEQLERQEQAAIDAGFWTLDADGEVQADLVGYQAAIARSMDSDRIPRIGSVARTGLQQRQLQQARAADVNLVARMTSDVSGESFGKAMAATHEFAATIANQDLQRQIAIDNQNFERAMISFQAENDQLQAAVNRGALSATQWMDRRERGIMAELDTVYRNAQMQFQKFGAELGLIVANVDNVTKTAMTAMGIESTAYDIWQAEYDKIMQPILDKQNQDLSDDLSADSDVDWLLEAIGIAIPALVQIIIAFAGGGEKAGK
jgi:hypothetical protein